MKKRSSCITISTVEQSNLDQHLKIKINRRSLEMKANIKGIVVMGIAALGIMAVTSAQAAKDTSTGTANATAKIITAISISKNATTDLAFGNVIASSAVGTVTVTPAGVRSSGGGATMGNGGGTAAAFTVSGEGTSAYSITLPADNVVTIKKDGASDTMQVNSFTTSKGVSNASQLIGGSDTFTVGGTLTVAAGQATGDYTGTFDVIVTYN